MATEYCCTKYLLSAAEVSEAMYGNRLHTTHFHAIIYNILSFFYFISSVLYICFYYIQSNEIQKILIKYNAYFKKAVFHSCENIKSCIFTAVKI